MRATTVAASVVIVFVVISGLYWFGGYGVSDSPTTTTKDDTLTKNNTSNDVMFTDVSSEVGFNYSQVTDVTYEGGTVSGVYVSDTTNSFDEDILAVNGTAVLFRNGGSEFTRSRVFGTENVTSAHFFDYDNDGWEDLYLMSDEGSEFFENNEGRFEQKDVGIDLAYESVRGAATADYTGNGCLDIFVIQAEDWAEKRPVGYDDQNVTIEEDNGEPNRLFRGNCSSFEETTEEAGIMDGTWSLATSFVDLTNDGYPDIHVANDFNNDVMYFNNGDGTFERHVLPEFTNRNGMSSEVADVNNDGYLDIFVTNVYAENDSHRYGKRTDGNNLLLNQGNGDFIDAADEYGVVDGGWGWASIISDISNNAGLDIVQTSNDNIYTSYPKLWLDRGNSNRLSRISPNESGFTESYSFGIAGTDYNSDGRYDVAIAEFSTEESEPEKYSLYENRFATGESLQIEVLNDGNHTSMGATVRYTLGNSTRYTVVTSESDYMSQDTRLRHIGLGENSQTDLHISWGTGEVLELSSVDAGQRVEISPEGIERSVPLD